MWKLCLFAMPENGDYGINYGLINQETERLICLECGAEQDMDDVEIIHIYKDSGYLSYANIAIYNELQPDVNEPEATLIDNFYSKYPEAVTWNRPSRNSD